MIWTKASRLTPPCDIPVYVKYKNEDLHVTIFSEENLKELITAQNLDQWKEKNKENEFDFSQPRILDFWSFIPILPPEEIIPALTNITYEIENIKLNMTKITAEINSIPRITSIQRMIEALQCQIAAIHPDPYQKWKERMVKGEEK